MTNKDPKNIFLMPCEGAKTRVHFNETVLRPVEKSFIFPTAPDETRQELEAIEGDGIAVWGSVDGSNNRIFFNKMQPGDYILFTVGRQVKVVGQIAAKTISPELSKILWPDDSGRVYSLIYFIDNAVEVNTPLAKVFTALGYSENYLLRGLTSVSSERLKAFYEKYENIFAVVSEDRR